MSIFQLNKQEEHRKMSRYRREFENENGENKTIYVKRPDNDSIKEADIHRAKVWNKAFKEGVMTKKEVKEMMKERGLWDDQKDAKEASLSDEIIELEKKLYTGGGKKSKPKLSDGREIAIQMRIKRAELRELIQERLDMDQNTAEALADNARFDYLVSCCSFWADDSNVFDSYEDYNERSSSLEAVISAQLLAQMMYNLDMDFENNLPENQFLKKFDLVNEDGTLIDPNNPDRMVDLEGRTINEFGHYLDDDGNRIDVDGNIIEEGGLYVLSDYEDDLRVKKPARKRRTTKKSEPKPEVTETEST